MILRGSWLGALVPAWAVWAAACSVQETRFTPLSDDPGASCADSTRNGDETDLDCGGSCPACALGRQCALQADCADSACVDGRCQAPASCLELQATGVATSGVYQLDLDRSGPLAAQPIACDMTTDGGGWTLVFHHRVGGGYFQGAGDALSSREGDPTGAKYSILGKLPNFRRGGLFTFRIDWPGHAPRNLWSQSSNPTDDVNVAGYAPIDVQIASNGWGGLELSTGAHGPGVGSTFLDGTVNHPNWFYAIGVYDPNWCGGGIPAADALVGACTPVQAVELWIR